MPAEAFLALKMWGLLPEKKENFPPKYRGCNLEMFTIQQDVPQSLKKSPKSR